jgi:hypothetical protein
MKIVCIGAILLGLVAAAPRSDARIAAANEAEQQQFRAQRIAKVQKQHPTWSRTVITAVVDHCVFVGMTGEQVIAAIGKPVEVKECSGIGIYWEWDYGELYLTVTRPERVYVGEDRVLRDIYSYKSRMVGRMLSGLAKKVNTSCDSVQPDTRR